MIYTLLLFLGVYIYFLYKLSHKPKKKPLNNSEKKEGFRCSECGGTMVEKNGRYGVFYGCESYPKCKHTIDI